MPCLLSEIAFQPCDGFVDNSALLAESKADKMVRITGRKERAQRDERDAGFTHQAFAELKIAFVRQAANVGGEEVGTLAGERFEAQLLDPRAQHIAIGLQRLGEIEREIHLMLEPIGDAELKRG